MLCYILYIKIKVIAICSQFESPPVSKISKYIQATSKLPKQYETSSVHIYPYTKAPVIIKNSGINELVLMNYSLVPYRSKTSRPKFSTYNARLDRPGTHNELELIYNAPTWKVPFKLKHCLVALLGFYESCRTGSHSGNIVKFSSTIPDEVLLAAGIWDEWTDHSTGEIIHSFAIITDDPVPFIQL